LTNQSTGTSGNKLDEKKSRFRAKQMHIKLCKEVDTEHTTLLVNNSLTATLHVTNQYMGNY